MAVDIRVKIIEVKGRLVTFEVTARDPLDEIGRGKHMRFVTDVQKTVERLKAKAAKAKAAGAALFMTGAAATAKQVPTYCYQCVAGPDLLTVRVEDGVALGVDPNFCAAQVHPGAGRICVKAYGLVQKTYNPQSRSLADEAHQYEKRA